jgi:heme exporter protein A
MLVCENLSIKLANNDYCHQVSFNLLPGAILYVIDDSRPRVEGFLDVITGHNKPISGNVKFQARKIKDIYSYGLDLHYAAPDMKFHEDVAEEFLLNQAAATDTQLLLDSALHYFSIEDLLEKKIRDLTIRERKLLLLAQLLIAPRKFWILDDMFTDLNESEVIQLKNLISIRSRDGGVVILSGKKQEIIPNCYPIYLQDYCNDKIPVRKFWWQILTRK